MFSPTRTKEPDVKENDTDLDSRRKYLRQWVDLLCKKFNLTTGEVHKLLADALTIPENELNIDLLSKEQCHTAAVMCRSMHSDYLREMPGRPYATSGELK